PPREVVPYDLSPLEDQKQQQNPVADRLKLGPREGVNYPLIYCEYYPEYEKCKAWLEKNLPTEFERVKLEEEAGDGTDDDKKRQKRGGKGLMKIKKKEEVNKRITVSSGAKRQKEVCYSSYWFEYILDKYLFALFSFNKTEIDLKVAAKFFGSKFACGSSVTGEGDVKDDLFDVIPDKWPEIELDYIEDLGDQKR
ncbi:hypothetical protein DOY81_011000, partial [Sarcophaga bullata]